MKKSRRTAGRRECPGCRELRKQLNAALKTIEELKAVIEELKARLGLNSQNSSRPPSSDPPGAPARPARPPSERKPGGQPGHPGTRRRLLAVEDVDEVIAHRPSRCEHCKAPLAKRPRPGDPPPRRHQVYEVPETPYTVTEHQAHGCMCPSCGKLTRAEVPAEVASSCFGPRLAAQVSMLTGVLQVSRRSAEEYVRDGLGIPIALGTVSNLEGEMSDALAEAHQEAAEEVRNAPAKNVDETGWKRHGEKCWLWTAATALVAFFVIHRRRGKVGFRALVGNAIKGIFTTDRWGAYEEIKTRLRQVCWAHLRRDFQKLVDRGTKSAAIGKEGLRITRQLFWLWKDFRAGEISRQALGECLRPLKKDLHDLLNRGARLRLAKVSTFCENLLALEPALWTFAYKEGVEPTNNHAERVLRRGVLWRKRAFGAHSERGCRFAERILTAVQTCRLQRRSVLQFLTETLVAHRTATSKPSLVHP